MNVQEFTQFIEKTTAEIEKLIFPGAAEVLKQHIILIHKLASTTVLAELVKQEIGE